MRLNKLYTVNKGNVHILNLRYNIYDWGGLAAKDKAANPWNYADDLDTTQLYMNSKGNNWFGLSKKNNPFSKGNLQGGLKSMASTPIGGALISGAAGAIGGLANSAISGGLESEAGSAISGIGSTVGSAVGAVNPVLGAAVSVGSQILGGVTNALFGEKVDQAKLNAANASMDSLRSFDGNVSSFDDIKGPEATASVAGTYKGGLFNSSAKRKQRALEEAMIDARQFAGRSIANNVGNLASDQLNDTLANYSAFGGPLDGVDPSTAIGYSLYTDKFVKDKAKSDTGMTNMFAGTPSTMFNLGGVVQTKGANWGNLTYINAGESHEENPNDGVQIGTDYQGVPNLVEEGEVIYDDYVFSNRLIVPRGKRGNYGKRNKYAKGGKLNKEGENQMDYSSEVLKPFEGLTFAEAAKKAEKQSGANERPNDPIAQRGLKATLGVLAGVQEKEREKEKLLEMQEAIDQMTPEEFAMLQQQMEAQKAAEEQAALQQQLMIPQGMQQMVPQEQMAAALGGPIYGLGGLLDNWDTTPTNNNNQEANIFEDGGFKEWWSKYISEPYLAMLESDDANSKYDANYGALYKAITGEEGPTDSQEVYNALLKIYQQDRSKFKPYDFKTNTFIEENPTGETQILTTEEGSQTIPTVEGPLTEVLAHANLSAEDWSKLSEKQLDRYIKQYKSSLKKDDRVNFQERLDSFNQQQIYKNQVEEYLKQLNDALLTEDKLKKFDYNQLERIASQVNPKYVSKDIRALSDNDAKEATEELRRNISDWAKAEDNKWTVGRFNDTFKSPNAHESWAKTPLDNKDRWKDSGYNVTNFGEELSKYMGSQTPGNLSGNYAIDNDFVLGKGDNGEDLKTVLELLNQQFYKNYTDAGKAALDRAVASNVKWRYNDKGDIEYLGDSKFNNEDADVIKAIYQQVGRTKTNPNGTNVPMFVTDDNGYLSINNAIKGRDASGNEKVYTASDYFDYLRNDNNLGVMHKTPTRGRASELYTLNDKDYYSLADIEAKTPNWKALYTEAPDTTTLEDGTVVHKLSYNNPLNIDVAELPEGIAKNPDGSYKATLDTTENDPFPKAANWPYLAGIGLLAGALGYNMLTPADYSNADAMIKAAQSAGTYNPIEFRPIGNYLTYRPMDIWYEQNRLNANARATDRAILNSGANQGAKNAALLASGYNDQIASGNLYRLALEYNDALRKQVGEFNKDTDKFNSEGFLKADMSNLDAATRARGYTLEGQRAGYAMRQAIDDAKANAISAGISGIGSLLYNWADSDYKNKLIGWGIKHGAYAPQKVSKGGKVRRRKGLSF